MSFTRRTRMISFRVSESEFQVLRSRSEAQGARSISDYARITLQESSDTADAGIEIDLDQLSLEIQRLSLDIRRLTDLLEGPGPRPMINGHAPLTKDHSAAQNGDAAEA